MYGIPINGETISDGSYDDVRRKDLLLPYLSGMIITDDPAKDTNDGTRRYALNPEFSPLVKCFGTLDWDTLAAGFAKEHGTLADRLSRPRHIQRVPIILPSGVELSFLGGPHNRLQKAIIEELLPRFGHGAEVLYVGDTAEKFHLIEAVHSANPISRERLLVLSQVLKECTANAVYVTAFLDKAVFRKFAPDIAWETEVWIASDPDHLIHFNGDKFFGPHIDDVLRPELFR